MSNFRYLAKGLAVVSTMLVAGFASADVLHLASGDRLSGEIDSISGGKVVLKMTRASAAITAALGASA